MKFENLDIWRFENEATRKVLRAVFIVLSLSILTRCANQVAPTGGPRDSLPPVVRSINPANEQRLFPTIGGRIFIEFDEYVQLKDASKEFFTSPLMKTRPTPTIRGKGVEIRIKDTLRQNQTYSLNFGSAIRDNNEGNPLTGFRYVFSTGKALDSLLVSGYAADAMKGDSVGRAYAFFIDAALDTIPEYDSLLFKAEPLQLGRAEGNGIFIAQNLSDMAYRVYALADANNNNKYDVGTDKVGFIDSVVNPATLAPTAVWFDEYRKYPTADPQLYFRLFAEEKPARQNLAGSERPGQHQVILRFSAPRPQIDTLTFEGIPPESVIREYMTPGRDTISLWFAVPPEAMPDTLRGRISYLKPDSVGVVAPFGQDLRLPWKLVESREEQREREKEERDREKAEENGEEYTPPPKPNPFRFKVDASSEINPEKSIPIEFDLPLTALDSARIVLQTVPEEGEPTAVPFHVLRDTMNIRRWVVTAPWDEERSYRLTIPEGVFVNVAGQRNDSLGANFKIVKRSSLGSVRMKVEGKTPEAKYIVQLVDKTGKTIMQEKKSISTGEYGFYYIPEGEVQIRITEDSNGNGRWDTGSLVERRQPERTEFYVDPTGSRLLESKAAWELDIELDMERIFAPGTIEKVVGDLRRAEDARVAKLLEEKAAKEAERKRQGTQGQGANGGMGTGGGGLGIGSALGGARQQIGSVAR
jgi:hypothetical protein